MTRLFRRIVLVFSACIALVALPTQALAQTRPVSVSDQRATERVIRSITRLADNAEIGYARLATNTDLLLTRLDAAGEGDMHLEDVATFYQRSVTATRYRLEAQINRDANRQIVKLRARSNSDALVEELEESRDLAIARVINAAAEANEGIEASVTSLITP